GGDKRAKLGALEKRIGAARLSFGREELLKEVLGIPAGSVTPFALINDTSRQVLPILDEEMMKAELVNYHPLRNDRTTVIKSADLLKFLQHLSYRPLIENCGE
ncbi:MAG: YbaK/EbsC family protein, partial [Dongiaceae bacterium]